MATITGKTAVVMAKQLAGDIKTGDKVVITDDLYTISDNNIVSSTNSFTFKNSCRSFYCCHFLYPFLFKISENINASKFNRSLKYNQNPIL